MKDIIVKEILLPSLRRLYENDYFNIYYGVSERNICARFAHHMEDIMHSCDYSEFFEAYYIDVEYNRMGVGCPKFYQNHKRELKYMVSDLLIHGRGRLQNLLAIEMKRKGNYHGVKEDKERLASLVSSMSDYPESEYIYNTIVGAFITYSPKDVKIELFEDNNGHGSKTGEMEFVCYAEQERYMTLEMISDSCDLSI